MEPTSPALQADLYGQSHQEALYDLTYLCDFLGKVIKGSMVFDLLFRGRSQLLCWEKSHERSVREASY